jgi:hypothetical protein
MGLLMAGQLLSSWARGLVPAASLRIVAPGAARIVNVAKDSPIINSSIGCLRPLLPKITSPPGGRKKFASAPAATIR